MLLHLSAIHCISVTAITRLFYKHYCRDTLTSTTTIYFPSLIVAPLRKPKTAVAQYFSRSPELTSWRCHQNGQARQPAAATNSTLNPRNRGAAGRNQRRERRGRAARLHTMRRDANRLAWCERDTAGGRAMHRGVAECVYRNAAERCAARLKVIIDI